MKLILIGVVTAILAITMLASGGQQAQDAEQLLAAAMNTALVDGNLQAAIEQYKKVVQSGNRGLAARALVQMGECYEKLGSAEAQNAYERVLRDYADQAQMAAQARTRLLALRGPSRTPSGSDPVIERVWVAPVGSAVALSPDARYVTFVDWTTGDIAIRDLVNGETRRLTNKGSWVDSDEYGEWPELSPDGNHVAYAWATDNSYELRVVHASGRPATPRVVYRNDQIRYMHVYGWSPDGQQILALLSRADANQIAFVSVADGSARVLKSLEWRYPRKMSLSPDGRYIAYDIQMQEDASDREVFVLSSDGTREVALAEHPGLDHSAVWFPDGKRILFLSDRGGSTGAWVVEVAEGRAQGLPHLVKPDMGDVVPLRFTRNGSYYYAVNKVGQDIFTASFDPATGSLVLPPAPAADRFLGSNLAPAWSPDGQYLAYFSRRGGRGERRSFTVTIHTVATGEKRELSTTLTLGDVQSSLRWFPDGRSLLVPAMDGRGRWSLYRLDVHTGAATVLKPGVTRYRFPSPALSPDGKTIYYLRESDNEDFSIIMAHDIEGGEDRELYRTTPVTMLAALALSKDGRQLAVAFEAGKSGSRLEVVPAAGGEARTLVRAEPGTIPRFGGIDWTPDGRHILFNFNRGQAGRSSPSAADIGLWRISVDGGTPEKILAPGGDVVPSVHPDGRRIAFSVLRAEGFEVWVMQNFLPR